MHPDLVECFHAHYHVEDPFYFVRFEFSTSCFIKKIIMDYFILTQWADWMDIVTVVGKFKVRLQNLNSWSNSFQPGEDDADRIAEEFLETRGRRYARRWIVARRRGMSRAKTESLPRSGVEIAGSSLNLVRLSSTSRDPR